MAMTRIIVSNDYRFAAVRNTGGTNDYLRRGAARLLGRLDAVHQPAFAGSPIFPSRRANAGSECRLVHMGRTLTDRTALPARSSYAFPSHSMA